MPDRIEIFNVVCPTGTAATAPLETALVCAPGIPIRFVIVMPAGHAGLTGIALGFGHQPVIPRTRGAFISGDGEVVEYELTNYPAGPQWSAFTCNLDTQDHVWQVRFELDEIGATTQVVRAPAAIAPEVIQAAAGTVQIGFSDAISSAA